jgi:hypothetical protein
VTDTAAPDVPVTDAPRVLVVRGPAQGLWRTGRRFGPEPVTLRLDELEAWEVHAIRGDPRLSISEG